MQTSAFLIDAIQSESYRADLGTWSTPTAGQVLELGCGTGRFTQWLIKMGFNVIAVDRSEESLTWARLDLPKTHFATVNIESAEDLAALRTHFGPFQRLFSRFVVHELADPIATFTAWRWLLEPGGQLVCIENAWVRTEWEDTGP